MQSARLRLALLAILVILSLMEPVLAANKFEVISSGVTGSGEASSLKREHLKLALFAVSGILLLSCLLAVFVPHRNALYLNFSNWRRSAQAMGVVSLIAFCFALVI